MKVTTQQLWRIGFDGDDYWMNRALAEAVDLPTDTDASNIMYASRELAAGTAVEVLRHYDEMTPGTGPMSNSFMSTADREAATAQISGGLKGPTYESRYKGEPNITAEDWAVTLTRPVEVRLVGRRVTKRSVTVEGEVWEKTTEEAVASDWFPGPDDTRRLNIWMETQHVAC